MMTPLEWQAWANITGQVIRTEEFNVLIDMDADYVSALKSELNAQWSRANATKGNK